MLDSGRNSRVCRVCGQDAPSSQLGFGSNGFDLLQCIACETIMVEKRPDMEELARLYDHLFSDGCYEQHRAEFADLQRGKIPRQFHRTAMLERVGRMCSGRRMVEIGGGTGAFGRLAVSRGWDYVDYDVSAHAVEQLTSLGLKGQAFQAAELPPLTEGCADVVVMWEVLEHVWDVHLYLTKIKDCLSPDGLLLLSTPNWRRAGYRSALAHGGISAVTPPIHVNFMTEEALRKTLCAAGFQATVIKRRIQSPSFTPRGLRTFLKRLLMLEEPSTLYGIARVG